MTPANDNRPAEFDKRLMEYVPAMKVIASRMGFSGEARDDLVTDTIMHCLKNWQTYREGGGFYTYLKWTMRGVAARRRRADMKERQYVPDPDGVFAASMPAPAAQEDHVELAQVVAMLGSPAGAVLLRRAMGGVSLRQIGQERGVSPQMAQLIESSERARLRRACHAA